MFKTNYFDIRTDLKPPYVPPPIIKGNLPGSPFITVFIDDYDFLLDDIYTIIQLCLTYDFYIPRFCYANKLNLAGNCRLCFVEESKSTKPVVSCITLATDSSDIFTDTQLSVQAREDLIELILLNHPLDCPICDQGGECDLQDQFMVFGNVNSRYHEFTKRNVIDKNISPFIKTLLNRCILCSRCTRFAHDVAGLYSFGLLGRGNLTEVSSYVNKLFIFELSGNVLDLCPVGALTAKLYSFSLRY
jgi:NADH dehydrogenase/NADH:ubiquinone oxidoreductase subunit G